MTYSLDRIVGKIEKSGWATPYLVVFTKSSITGYIRPIANLDDLSVIATANPRMQAAHGIINYNMGKIYNGNIQISICNDYYCIKELYSSEIAIIGRKEMEYTNIKIKNGILEKVEPSIFLPEKIYKRIISNDKRTKIEGEIKMNIFIFDTLSSLDIELIRDNLRYS